MSPGGEGEQNDKLDTINKKLSLIEEIFIGEHPTAVNQSTQGQRPLRLLDLIGGLSISGEYKL